jgi:hypothetical protein
MRPNRAARPIDPSPIGTGSSPMGSSAGAELSAIASRTGLEIPGSHPGAVVLVVRDGEREEGDRHDGEAHGRDQLPPLHAGEQAGVPSRIVRLCLRSSHVVPRPVAPLRRGEPIRRS